MAKAKTIIDDQEIAEAGSFETNAAAGSKAFDLKYIEEFIEAAGSDDLPTFGGKFEGGIHCQQISDELAPCILAIIQSGKVIKSYLEIGVAAGGTTFIINYFLTPDRIVLIDDNKHHKARLRPGILADVKKEEIIGDSRDKSIVEKAQGIYDLIIIDGNHLYEGVKADINNYLPMLSEDGFLILHDSALNQLGVPRAVQELKESMELVGEYVTGKHSQPCGVALFRKAIAE